MRLLFASFILLSIHLGAEPLPRIAVLPAMVYQGHGHQSQTAGTQGLNRRVASNLLQGYHCQIVSRNNMLAFDQERVIRSLQERSPEFAAVPVAADFVILSFIERQSGALRLHFAPVTESMRLSKPLFIPKGDPDDLLSEVPATITDWIATNLQLKPKAAVLDERKANDTKQVWAVLPTDAPSGFLGEHNNPKFTQGISHGIELAVAEAAPGVTMVDRTAIAAVIREWELEHLHGSQQHSLASHVLGANIALQAVVSHPNSEKNVRFDLLAADPLTGTILAARTGRKNRDSLGLQAFIKEVASLLDEVSQTDLPSLRNDRPGDDERRQHESLLHYKQASLPSSMLERVRIGGSGRLINSECAASLLRPRSLEELKRIGHLAGFLHPLTGWETSEIGDHAIPRKMLRDLNAKGDKGAAYYGRLNSLFEPVTARLLALDTLESRAEAAKIQSNLANYEEALRISEIDRTEILRKDPAKASLRTFISAKALIGLERYAEAIKVIEERSQPKVDHLLMISDCHRMLGNAEGEHETLDRSAPQMQVAHRWYQERLMNLKMETGKFESLISSHRAQLSKGTSTLKPFVDLYVQALLKTGDNQAAADVCNSMLLCPAYRNNSSVQKRYRELLAESGGKEVDALPLPSEINPIGKQFVIELYPLGEFADPTRLAKMAARISDVWGCEVHLHKTMPMPREAPLFDARRNQFKARWLLAAAAVALPPPGEKTLVRLFYTEGLPLIGNTGSTAGDALGMVLSGTAFLGQGYRTADLEATNELCSAVLVGTQLGRLIQQSQAEMLEEHRGTDRLPNVSPGVFSESHWQSDPKAPLITNRLSLPTTRFYKKIDWRKVSEKFRSRYMFIKKQFTDDTHAAYVAILKKAGVGSDPKVFTPKPATANFDLND